MVVGDVCAGSLAARLPDSFPAVLVECVAMYESMFFFFSRLRFSRVGRGVSGAWLLVRGVVVVGAASG